MAHMDSDVLGGTVKKDTGWDADSEATEEETARMSSGLDATRQRTFTMKGREYALETKSKMLNLLIPQLKRKFVRMEQLMAEEHHISVVRAEHMQWLSLFEEFLQVYRDYCAIIDPGDDRFEEQATWLRTCKSTIEGWFLQPEKHQDGNSLICPRDSASQIPRRKQGGSKISSLATTVSSARLKGEQRRVELSTKMSALKRKRALELAKLNLKLQEEELEHETEIEIVDRKNKVLDQFENREQSVRSKCSYKVSVSERNARSRVGLDLHSLQNVNCHENVQSVKPTAEPFIPVSSCHAECVDVEHCVFNQAHIPSNDNVVSDDVSPQFSGVNPLVSVVEETATNSQVMVSVVRQLRKPIPDIKKFGGDPLGYKKFIRQFKTKIVINSEDDDERLNYLEQFTEGEANKIVNGFSYLDAEQGYPSALKELEQRYGDEEVLANTFVKRALDWPTIKADNPKALDEFAIFLGECENAIRSIEAVKVLQYPENMKRLVSKLPFHYHDKWRNVVQQTKLKSETVKFQQLSHFVKMEAKKACDPTYGREALRVEQKPASGKGQASRQSNRTSIKGSFATKVSDTSLTTPASFNNGPTGVKAKAKQDSVKITCIYCERASHSLEMCDSLSKRPHSERIDFLKTKGLCFACLRAGHQRQVCRNKSICTVCKYRHPTVLHDDTKVQSKQWSPATHNSSVDHVEKRTTACTSLMNTVCGRTGAGEGECTMAVIPVKVKLENGLQTVTTYAFLDPGSSVSFCTEHLMRKVGGCGQQMNITLDTMGVPHNLHTFAVNGLQVGDLHLNNVIDLPRVYTKEKMPISKGHIPTPADIARWSHLEDVTLPHVDAEIGMLIGNNVPDAYTPIQLRTGPRGSPHATQSLLGWIVWNVVREDTSASQDIRAFSVNRAEVIALKDVEELRNLDKLVRDSINLDFPERLIDDKRECSQEDKRFVEQVNHSIQLKDGHYSIGLPFRKEGISMPNNQTQALRRLESLKKKLERNPVFRQHYNEFMAQILDKGYAEEVAEEDLGGSKGRVWYTPHHGVYHPRKPNKLRVVFDCTATYLGTSLNNVLLQGPDMTNNLIGVLLRFRQEKIAFMGDIEAMFYQVHVPEEDCDFLRFYWWPNGNLESNPVVHRMRVHLFGAVSSPSYSSFALRRTADDNQGKSKTAVCDAVKKNFYVDDYLASTATEDGAVSLIHDTSEMCLKGGFRLTKWTSNNHRVLESIPKEDRSKEVKLLDLKRDELPAERALGVYWVTEADSFGFKIGERSVACTRRGILSLSSSVYDPLGITAPFVLTAKCLLQELCRQGAGRDDAVQGNNLKKWNQWLADLKLLENLQTSRCYKPANFKHVVSCQLHNFADASDNGYGMVSYLRLTDEDGHVHCAFVLGKSRVAPLKKITIPRMELTAATALVRLNRMLVKELDYPIDESYFWTDSMSVLRYIANESSRFHTFVANRVTVIREATDVQQWRFVGTKSNPADYASRGLVMGKLLITKQWFNGPDFLWKSEDEWPQQTAINGNCPDDDVEVKRQVHTIVGPLNQPVDRLLRNYSDWLKLRKAAGWVLVAFGNLKRWVVERKLLQQEIPKMPTTQENRENQLKMEISRIRRRRLSQGKAAFKTCLSAETLQDAEKALVRFIQRQHFQKEIDMLDNGQGNSHSKVTKASSLFKLDPFLSEGILRVGGRLDRSTISFDAKHPMVLPKESPVTKLILEDAHRSVGHLGKNSILAHIRQQYWIIGVNSEIKKMLSRCVTCKRYQSPSEVQKMASLPADRVIPDEPPFSHTGMDYFGPFEIKRGRSVVKSYGVLFTCLAVRAVHLEVAASLDTDSCILAIRRFIARRGPISLIRSDNGTNLVGAERELREEIAKLNVQKIQGALLKKNITWEFNPPSASHFGGVWERLIRLVRKVLYSLLHTQTIRLDDEGLQTLFCEVEAILNGRPITEAPYSPKDLDALTPNHLLLLRAGEQMPPGLFDKSDIYPRRRWRQIQYLADLFWKRWVKEYLPMLQQRQKWNSPRRNLAINDVVLIMDSSPRNSLSLGRVLDVFKDKRGFVRIVKLKTRSTILLRPVAKL